MSEQGEFMMKQEDMGKVINRALDNWLATTHLRKPAREKKFAEERKPRSGGHNRLPEMTEEQHKIYRKLRVAGMRRVEALAAAGKGADL